MQGTRSPKLHTTLLNARNFDAASYHVRLLNIVLQKTVLQKETALASLLPSTGYV
jgi:hypothetical protein